MSGTLVSNDMFPQLAKDESEEVIKIIRNSLSCIRNELYDNPYIIEAIKVLPVGGYRSAIGSLWNAVVDDLRNKIMFRSLSLFNKEMNLAKKINCYEDFQNYVNDDQLIEGAFKIGVIGWEASRVLKQAKETRHIFDGHPKSTDPSIIKVLSMFDDCVKYVLSIDYPMQIIDIDEYLNTMETDEYDRNAIAIENALGDLPELYKQELIHRLFSTYVESESTTVVRSNIEFCAPILWKGLPKEVKQEIVRRVDRVITKGNASHITLAFSFVELVGGMQYLSVLARKYRVVPLVKELTENLDTWKIENRCIKELERFAAYIPSDVVPQYVNALTQTYVGHMGGSAYFSRTDFYANDAAIRIPGMFEKFDDLCADAFLNCIRNNRLLQSRIQYPAKIRRLRTLANIVLEKVSDKFRDRNVLDLLADEKREKEFFENIKRIGS